MQIPAEIAAAFASHNFVGDKKKCLEPAGWQHALTILASQGWPSVFFPLNDFPEICLAKCHMDAIANI